MGRTSKGAFGWQSPRHLPRGYDLERRGWHRIGCEEAERAGEPVLWLVDREHGFLPQPIKHTLVTDIADPRLRARLLALGVGDVLAPGTALDELAIRARRVLDRAGEVSRCRSVGALTLDLLRRDGFVRDRRLCLHPREFEMAWHLAELGPRGASRNRLLREVWDIRHEPETNSVAVHAFRLRAKLRVHGLAGMLATDRAGRYRLIPLDEPDILRDKAGNPDAEERERDRTVL
ncbi:MAG: hypothetical protein COW16_00195 [Sphingomonadales bacterium CG12_big_fil_rev_8_21_14_0_65_65_10]|nr:MAG: hypothetical protein COW16_00195 [Sphingomonadales bacterium CG12_big_fil_rev_8_21_14_0_65_65_10]